MSESHAEIQTPGSIMRDAQAAARERLRAIRADEVRAPTESGDAAGDRDFTRKLVEIQKLYTIAGHEVEIFDEAEAEADAEDYGDVSPSRAHQTPAPASFHDHEEDDEDDDDAGPSDAELLGNLDDEMTPEELDAARAAMAKRLEAMEKAELTACFGFPNGKDPQHLQERDAEPSDEPSQLIRDYYAGEPSGGPPEAAAAEAEAPGGEPSESPSAEDQPRAAAPAPAAAVPEGPQEGNGEGGEGGEDEDDGLGGDGEWDEAMGGGPGDVPTHLTAFGDVLRYWEPSNTYHVEMCDAVSDFLGTPVGRTGRAMQVECGPETDSAVFLLNIVAAYLAANPGEDVGLVLRDPFGEHVPDAIAHVMYMRYMQGYVSAGATSFNSLEDITRNAHMRIPPPPALPGAVVASVAAPSGERSEIEITYADGEGPETFAAHELPKAPPACDVVKTVGQFGVTYEFHRAEAGAVPAPPPPAVLHLASDPHHFPRHATFGIVFIDSSALAYHNGVRMAGAIMQKHPTHVIIMQPTVNIPKAAAPPPAAPAAPPPAPKTGAKPQMGAKSGASQAKPSPTPQQPPKKKSGKRRA